MARSGVIYGPSGSWKTTAAKHFSHYIAEVTGKATYLLTLDGGGYSPCQPEVDAGMIEVFRCDPNAVPYVFLRKVSQGYWPADPTDPYGPKGLTRMDFSRFGGLVFEGWTSASSVGMRYLPDTNKNVGGENRRLLGGFDNSITIDGQQVIESFLSSTRGDFGFVQNFMYGLVSNFNGLPLHYVMHTALEGRGEEDDRSPIYGPGMVGKKATPQSPSWVGDCIHAQDHSVKVTIKTPDLKTGAMREEELIEVRCRYYFVRHPDPVTGIPFPAKPRVTPEKVAELRRVYPYGYFEPTPERGFDEYLRVCDRLAAEAGEASSSLQQWRARMDGKLGRQPAAAPKEAR